MATKSKQKWEKKKKEKKRQPRHFKSIYKRVERTHDRIDTQMWNQRPAAICRFFK